MCDFIKDLSDEQLSCQSQIDTFEEMKEYVPKKYISTIDKYINDIAEKYYLCPYCHTELESQNYTETHSELDYGKEETIYYLKCPTCGYINN